MAKLELENISTVALDTAVLIYYVEMHPTYLRLIEPIIDAIDQDEVVGIASTVTLLEVLVLPLREKDFELVQEYQSILLHSNLELIPLSGHIAQKAAEIRAVHNLRTPDAIHVATAIIGGVDLPIANDKKWQRITEIPIVTLDDLVHEV